MPQYIFKYSHSNGRLETSLCQVLFNPSEYTMFERTERTEKDIWICVQTAGFETTATAGSSSSKIYDDHIFYRMTSHVSPFRNVGFPRRSLSDC